MSSLPDYRTPANGLLLAFAQWLRAAHLTEKTTKNYLSDLRQVQKWLQETRPEVDLSALTVSLADDYTRDLQQAGVPTTTIDRRRAAISAWQRFQAAVQPPSPHQTRYSPESARHQWLRDFSLALRAEGCKPHSVTNYVSDVKQFLFWQPEMDLKQLLQKPKVAQYLEELPPPTPRTTQQRKLVSLRKFARWATNHGLLAENPLASTWEKLWYQATPTWAQLLPLAARTRSAHTPAPQTTTPAPKNPTTHRWQNFFWRWYGRYHQWPLSTYLHLGILLTFAIMVAVFGYEQFYLQVAQNFAYPSDLKPPNRVLSFQGRLTDSAGTPITTPINFEFRLFNALTNGTELWDSSDSGACSIDPDQDGVFATTLGNSCGGAITANIFSENQNVWLEVKVSSETLTPRQPINAVPYALNSETLQGFPPSLGGEINTIPVINALGQILIGASNPQLIASSGAFLIQGESLLFQTESGTAGDITFAPDAGGSVNVQSATTTQDSLHLTNANLTTGNLVRGEVGNNNTGYNFLSFASGTSLDNKFVVDALGHTTIDGYLQAPGATLSANYADGIPLVVRGAGSHTANLAEWQNSSGSPLAYISAAGNLNANSLLTGGTARISSGGNLTNIGTTQFNSLTYTWPGSQTIDYVLKTNGSGTLSWVDVNTLVAGAINYWQLNNTHILSPSNNAFDLTVGGTSTTGATISLRADGSAVFNEQGNDRDFRIEGSGQANAFFVDGANGNIGLKTNNPGAALHVNDTGEAIEIGTGADTATYINAAGTRMYTGYDGTNAVLQAGSTVGLEFNVNNATFGAGTAAILTSGGNFGIGDVSPAAMFTVGVGDLFQVNSSGEIAQIDGVAHTLTDNAGNLQLNSNGTMTIVSDDLQVSGADLLGALGETRLTLSDSNDQVVITGDANITGTIMLPNSQVISGVTNYVQHSHGISVGGATTYYIDASGHANLNNITGAGTLDINGAGTHDIAGTLNLSGGTLQRSGGNLAVQTVTSGNLTLAAAGELTLDDTRVTTAIPLSLTDTDLSLFPAGDRAVVDALNYLYQNNDPNAGSGNWYWSRHTDGVLYPNQTYESVMVGGNSTASAKVHLDATTGNVTLANGGKIKPLSDSTTALNIANAAGTSFVVFDSTTQYVGIGAATAPTARLTLPSGTTAANGIALGSDVNLYRAGANSLRTDDTFTINLHLNVNGNTTIGNASADTLTANAATWTFANDTNFVLSGGLNGLSFDTNTLSIDANADLVGIGTTAPGSKLHVVQGSGGAQAVLGDTGTNTNLGGLGFASTLTTANYAIGGDGSHTYLNTPTAGSIYFRVNNANQMFMTSTGQLGVGSGAGTSGQVNLASATTDAGGIYFGTDTNLYRYDTNKLKTDDLLISATGLAIGANALSANVELDVTGDTQASGQVRVGNLASDPTAIGAGSIYYNTSNNLLYFYNGSTWNPLQSGSSSNPGFYLDTTNKVTRQVNPTTDFLVGGAATASATFRVEAGTGRVTVGTIQHAIADVSGNLKLDSQGTFVDIQPDLKISGGDILGSLGETRVTLSDSQDTVLVTGKLDVDGLFNGRRGATLSAAITGDRLLNMYSATSSSLWYVDSRGTFYSSKGVNGGTAWLFDTTSNLANSDPVADLFAIRNNGTANLRLDNDGNLIVAGRIYQNTTASLVSLAPASADSDTGASTNSIWISKTQNSGNLILLQNNSTNRFSVDYAGNASISTTLAIGVFNEVNAGTCNAAAEGRMYYNKVSKRYRYCDGSSWTNIAASADLPTTYSNSGSVADGSSLTVTHNLGTNNILAEAWRYDASASAYLRIDEPQGRNHDPSDIELKGYWKMEEASGDLVDQSQHANTLIDKNSPVYQQSGLVNRGYGITFNRADSDYFCTGSGTTCADDNDFDTTGDFSLGGWIKVSAAPADIDTIMAKYAPNDAIFSLTLDATYARPIFNLYANNSTASLYSINSGQSIHDNQWHFIVARVAGSNMQLYIDSKLVGNTGISGRDTGSAAPLIIGNLDTFGTAAWNFDGLMDEMFVYNRALGQQEIVDLYNYGARKFRIQQNDNNSVTVYNYSGITQTLRMTVSSSGADVAENYLTYDHSLETGDLVTVDRTHDVSVSKTDASQGTPAIGVVSTRPGITLGPVDGTTPGVDTSISGDEVLSGRAKSVPVALTGRVPAKVTNENGAIRKGDAIGLARVAGFGAKAVAGGPIVGYALENWGQEAQSTPTDGVLENGQPEMGTVLVYVQPEYHTLAQNMSLEMLDDLVLTPDTATHSPTPRVPEAPGLLALDGPGASSASALLAQAAKQATAGANLSYSLRTLSGNLWENVGAFSRLITANLQAGVIRVENLFALRVETEQIRSVSLDTDFIRPLSSDDIVIQLGGDSATDSATASESASGQFLVFDAAGQQLAAIDRTGFRSPRAVIAEMNNRYLSVSELLTAQQASIAGELTAQSARVAQLQAVDATISGTLYANNINGLSTANLSDFTARVSELVRRQTETNGLNTPPPDSSPAALLTNSQLATDDSPDTTLTARLAPAPDQDLADINLDDLRDLTLDGTLLAQSLATARTQLTDHFLSFTLRPDLDPTTCTGLQPAADCDFVLQPSGQGVLRLLANNLVISQQGGVVINNNLAVNGDVQIKGRTTLTGGWQIINPGSENGPILASVTASGAGQFQTGQFQKLIIASDQQNTTPTIENKINSNATTGTAVLGAGQTRLTIHNPQVNGQSLIYLTPTSSTQNRVLFVSSKQGDDSHTADNEAAFTVALDEAISSDLSFNWWVIN